LKKILKSNAVKFMASLLAAAYIWVVYRTTRWQVLNGELPHQYMREEQPFIMSFWHGRLLMMPISVQKKTRIKALISHHGDGELIARTIRHWGQGSIRGSSSRGAATAIKEMLRALRRNEVVVITPDGPRGPRMRVQAGVMRIAAMSGMPVFPVSYSTSRGRTLDSWDRFFVPRPFGRGVIIWGDPVIVARHDDGDTFGRASLEIERSLTDLTQRADELCGQPPVQPDSSLSSGGSQREVV
jgi:hypothetical protein